MKRNLKRLVAVGIACILLCGTSITSAAAGEVVPPEHKCEFSYMGINEYQGQEMGIHPYYVTDDKGNVTMKSCAVTLIYRREVWRCGCLKVEYRNYHTIQRHSACGKGDC